MREKQAWLYAWQRILHVAQKDAMDEEDGFDKMLVHRGYTPDERERMARVYSEALATLGGLVASFAKQAAEERLK